MNPIARLFTSSLGKKYLMAISGLIWAGFVFGHMAGNLQMFLDPFWINSYAYKLQHFPYGLLWVVRAGMLTAFIVHVATAITLAAENKAARPQSYDKDVPVRASWSSRYMILSGTILLLFLIFHIAHYTVHAVPGHEYGKAIVFADGTEAPTEVYLAHGHGNEQEFKLDNYGNKKIGHNVYNMVVAGFQSVGISIFYLVAVFLLCRHLSHGVSSMFQSIGLRNETWRCRLDVIANIYGWVVFLGYASLPIGVLTGVIAPDLSIPTPHGH